MITHDLSAAAHFADRIASCTSAGSSRRARPHRVIARPAAPVHAGADRAWRRGATRADALGARILRRRARRRRDVPTGCRFHPRCPIAAPDCANHDPRLTPACGPLGRLIRLGEHRDGLPAFILRTARRRPGPPWRSMTSSRSSSARRLADEVDAATARVARYRLWRCLRTHSPGWS